MDVSKPDQRTLDMKVKILLANLFNTGEFRLDIICIQVMQSRNCVSSKLFKLRSTLRVSYSANLSDIWQVIRCVDTRRVSYWQAESVPSKCCQWKIIPKTPDMTLHPLHVMLTPDMTSHPLHAMLTPDMTLHPLHVVLTPGQPVLFPHSNLSIIITRRGPSKYHF